MAGKGCGGPEPNVEIDFGREERVRVSKTHVTLALRHPRHGAAAGPSHFIFCFLQRTPASSKLIRKYVQEDISRIDSQAIMLLGARSLPRSRLVTMLPSLDSANSALKSLVARGSALATGAGPPYVAACDVQPIAVENDGRG